MKPLATLIPLAVWLTLIAALVGCGGAETEPPAIAVTGPALIMFYTDG